MERSRLRRTMLFVPGDRPDRIKKAAGLDADMVTIDLEDAVAPDRKAAARQAVKEVLAETDFGDRECAVRINSIYTLNGARDMVAIKEFSRLPDTVVVAKVETAIELQLTASLLAEISPAIELIPLLESAKGILNAGEIAAASPRVTGIMFGGADLSADIGCPMTWEALLGSRQRFVLAAAAARVDALDVPYLNLEDVRGLEEETRRVAGMGFTGKAAIHPGQVAVINRVFQPGEDEIRWAERVLEAVQQAGQGAIRVDGKMVDAAVSKRAEKIVQAARRSGA